MGNLCSSPPKREVLTNRPSIIFDETYGGVTYEALNGDIYDADVEAIADLVNGSNQQLHHQAGLGNLLLVKGGQVIQQESNKIREKHNGEIPIGSAVVTSGGKLKAKVIIHAILPIWKSGTSKEDEKLAECVTNVLNEAQKLNIKSIAVPALDGGALGFPKERAAKIVIETCIKHLNKYETISINRVKFINPDSATVGIYKDTLMKALNIKAENSEPIKLHREDAGDKTEGEEEPVIVIQDLKKTIEKTKLEVDNIYGQVPLEGASPVEVPSSMAQSEDYSKKLNELNREIEKAKTEFYESQAKFEELDVHKWDIDEESLVLKVQNKEGEPESKTEETQVEEGVIRHHNSNHQEGQEVF